MPAYFLNKGRLEEKDLQNFLRVLDMLGGEARLLAASQSVEVNEYRNFAREMLEDTGQPMADPDLKETPVAAVKKPTAKKPASKKVAAKKAIKK